MAHYTVRWEIDVYADTPLEAALEAEGMMANQLSQYGEDDNVQGGVFDVFRKVEGPFRIDLEEYRLQRANLVENDDD